MNSARENLSRVSTQASRGPDQIIQWTVIFDVALILGRGFYVILYIWQVEERIFRAFWTGESEARLLLQKGSIRRICDSAFSSILFKQKLSRTGMWVFVGEEEEEAQALSVSSSLDCRNILCTLQISGKSSQRSQICETC